MTLAPAQTLDTSSRPLGDLRISVTDRCNFRCRYCMPREHFGKEHAFLPRDALLRFEEITRFSRVAVELGVRKIRLTGGEPLLRADLPRLVGWLAEIPGVDLALTTNGVLLPRYAEALRRAGLGRLTVSLDALTPEVFQRMTDSDYGAQDVLRGIAAAEAAGFSRIKINCVVQKGVNDGDVVALARHFRGSGHIVRFIEYMDVGATNGWRLGQVLSAGEILTRLAEELELEALAENYAGEVARRYRHRDGSGEIGIIASVTRPFCGACTRLRLASDGQLYTCLFANTGHDLRALLRSEADDTRLRSFVAELWQKRADRYSEDRSRRVHLPRIEMSYIGG